jgi:calcium-dependent protein kinase
MQHKWLKEQLGYNRGRNSLVHKSLRTGEFTNYLAMKKLKKAALGYIASNLTQAEVGALEEMFCSMDKNKDGYITLTTLDEAIAKGNFKESLLGDLQALRHDLDVGDEEKINWRDFLALTMDRSLALREDNIKLAFEHFKHTDADYLTVSDLAEICGGEGQAKEVMELLDSDGDGKVSFEDFRLVLVESIDDMEEEGEMH